MRRALALMVSLLAAGIVLVQPSGAAATPAETRVAYAYNSHHQSALVTHLASEHGPPAAYGRATTHDAVDLWSDGASECPSDPTSRAIHDYDDTALPVRADRAPGTTNEPARTHNGALSSFPRWQVAAKAVPEVAEGGGRLFVTSGRGVTYDIPKGWTQRMADNGKGLVFQRGGATGNADMIRIMEPTAKYPEGYVRVYNSYGQPVDVFGKPGPASTTHISQGYMGQWPGWPQ